MSVRSCRCRPDYLQVSRPVIVGLLTAGMWLAGLTPTHAQEVREPGAVSGQTIDATTGRPVEWVQVVLVRPERGTVADGEGRFTIGNVQPGTHRLKTFRIGYRSEERVVTVPHADTVHVVLELSPSVLGAAEIFVEAVREDAGGIEAAHSLDGRQLRQKLGTTIAETLDGEPGLAMRTMGPAPARPVLRGLGGERLLVLEDGGRTGDLSASSTDHAVVIEPMTAERIDIIRGPQALQYGSSVLGGVVNVSRNYVPTRLPDRLHGSLSLQGQSVNNGFAGGARLEVPARPIALRADGSLRRASDIQTPVGRLANTDIVTANGALGASIVHGHGMIGIAGSYYASDYGIPGGFVGAHPNGVDITVDRQHIEARADLIPHRTFVDRYEARAAYSRYHHKEFEASGRLGIEFGLLSYDATILAHTVPGDRFTGGAVGVWVQYRDFASGGFAYTPASTERSFAAFAYQHTHLGSIAVEGGVRLDYQIVSPRREHTASSSAGGSGSGLTLAVSERRFGGASASILAAIPVGRTLSIGSITTRSLRLPGIEELFSEGPHLAAYSFEVGNPALEVEKGLGQEVFVRLEGNRVAAMVAGYFNMIDDYIYPRNTGEINARTLLPIYQYSGERVRIAGWEGTAEFQVLRRVTVSGAFSYVHGTLLQDGDPLPWIPPFSGRFGVRYRPGPLVVGGDLILAIRQDRIGMFEEPSEGYSALRGFAQFYVTVGGLLHTLDLVVENLTDATYRDHLSRVKSIMPEPGRNVKMLYRAYF